MWAFSTDSGKTFGKPQVVDDASPYGRSDVAFLDDGSVLILWLAKSGPRAELKLRRYASPGKGKPKTVDTVVVTEVNSSRATGFPQLASFGNRALIAWTDTDRKSIGLSLVIAAKR